MCTKQVKLKIQQLDHQNNGTAIQKTEQSKRQTKESIGLVEGYSLLKMDKAWVRKKSYIYV